MFSLNSQVLKIYQGNIPFSFKAADKKVWIELIILPRI